MSIAGGTVWEVQTGGSDSASGGGYSVNNTAGTNGAATSANTASPVFTSATYNFVAGDVGARVYIKSGTNWIPGWYTIASVAANAATLTATAGTAVLADTFAASTATGCATTASPTSATWGLDYSQGTAISLTGLTTAAANAIILTASAAVAMIGNIIQITGGTNFTVGFYTITAVTAGVSITVDRTCTSAAGALGTAVIGGPLASASIAATNAVSGNTIFVKSGSYTMSSATSTASNAIIALPNSTQFLIGYGTQRGDSGTKPVFTASGIATATLVAHSGINGMVRNIKVDGATLTAIRGISVTGNGSRGVDVIGNNCTNNGLFGANGLSTFFNSYATGCTTQYAMSVGDYVYCVADSNTGGGIQLTSSTNPLSAMFCIASNNTGNGFNMSQTNGVVNCTAYNNSGDGFDYAGPRNNLINCVSYGNGGFDYNIETASISQGGFIESCAGGTINGRTTYSRNFITLTANPFTNAAGGDFSLNAVSGGGAACRAAMIPAAFPGISTNQYMDLGAAQHQDPNLVGRMTGTTQSFSGSNI